MVVKCKRQSYLKKLQHFHLLQTEIFHLIVIFGGVHRERKNFYIVGNY
jgi:hypothetical protein